ncbi:MAG: hypothetical protein V1781_04415 [Bacteroidota bacterium]
MKNLKCDICGSDMELEISSQKGGRGRSGKYRIRRYRCTNNLVCDHAFTVFADGVRDTQDEPREAVETARKMYEAEEDARS